MAVQPIIRISYGYQWVCQGFVKSFKHLIEVYGFKRAIEVWQKRMMQNDLPISSRQRKIFGQIGMMENGIPGATRINLKRLEC
jgi:hypothetical protein